MYKYAKQAYGFPKGCLVALLISLLSYLSLSLLCCIGVFMTKKSDGKPEAHIIYCLSSIRRDFRLYNCKAGKDKSNYHRGGSITRLFLRHIHNSPRLWRQRAKYANEHSVLLRAGYSFLLPRRR